MMVTEEGWALVPPFPERLAAAMDHAGLTNSQLCERLNALGIPSTPQKIHKWLKGRSDQPGQHVNPTLIAIAGCAIACNVSAGWFFGDLDDLRDERAAMIDRYATHLATNG